MYRLLSKGSLFWVFLLVLVSLVPSRFSYPGLQRLGLVPPVHFWVFLNLIDLALHPTPPQKKKIISPQQWTAMNSLVRWELVWRMRKRHKYMAHGSRYTIHYGLGVCYCMQAAQQSLQVKTLSSSIRTFSQAQDATGGCNFLWNHFMKAVIVQPGVCSIVCSSLSRSHMYNIEPFMWFCGITYNVKNFLSKTV